jgi:hypothetical protein
VGQPIQYNTRISRRQALSALTGLAATLVPFPSNAALFVSQQDEIDRVLVASNDLGSAVTSAITVMSSPNEAHDRMWAQKCGPISAAAFGAVIWNSRHRHAGLSKDELRAGLDFDAMLRALQDEALPAEIRTQIQRAMNLNVGYRYNPDSRVTRDWHSWIEYLSATALTVTPLSKSPLLGLVSGSYDLVPEHVDGKPFNGFDVSYLETWRQRIIDVGSASQL